jgi:hypothetical protein
MLFGRLQTVAEKKDYIFEFVGIHRRGVEPLPLAWKASMITASPSVSKKVIVD